MQRRRWRSAAHGRDRQLAARRLRRPGHERVGPRDPIHPPLVPGVERPWRGIRQPRLYHLGARRPAGQDQQRRRRRPDRRPGGIHLRRALPVQRRSSSPMPNLAECEPDADELVWTCTVVEATFHNGDADDGGGREVQLRPRHQRELHLQPVDLPRRLRRVRRGHRRPHHRVHPSAAVLTVHDPHPADPRDRVEGGHRGRVHGVHRRRRVTRSRPRSRAAAAAIDEPAGADRPDSPAARPPWRLPRTC